MNSDSTGAPLRERDLFGALSAPLNFISATVTRHLRALRPDQHLAFVELYAFDLDEFLAAGRCERAALPEVPPLFRLVRDETGKKLVENLVHGWFKVRWEGHLLEVVSLTYGADNCPDRASWVIAASRELAERFVAAVTHFCDEVRGEVLVFEDGRFRKSEELFASIQQASFDDLVLGGTLKDELRTDVSRFFARRAFYEEHRLPWKRGLLLLGPPGNGKTQTLKALLKEAGKPVLYVKTFHDGREGEPKYIRAVFARARLSSPCILVIEDLDCALEEASRSVFLNELDGFANNAGILVVATTNHPHKLDRSILDRPSRFDRKFHFPVPAAAEREAFIARWNAAQSPSVQLSPAGIGSLVERSAGFTFAYLKELLLAAALAWAEEGKPGTMDEIARTTARALKKEMQSVEVVLGPAAGLRPIGFVEARGE